MVCLLGVGGLSTRYGWLLAGSQLFMAVWEETPSTQHQWPYTGTIYSQTPTVCKKEYTTKRCEKNLYTCPVQ